MSFKASECCVCHTPYWKADPGTMQHRFPTARARMRKWANALNLDSKKIQRMMTKNAFRSGTALKVCSRHFDKLDYDVVIRRGVKCYLLKKEAVPSLFNINEMPNVKPCDVNEISLQRKYSTEATDVPATEAIDTLETDTADATDVTDVTDDDVTDMTDDDVTDMTDETDAHDATKASGIPATEATDAPEAEKRDTPETEATDATNATDVSDVSDVSDETDACDATDAATAIDTGASNVPDTPVELRLMESQEPNPIAARCSSKRNNKVHYAGVENDKSEYGPNDQQVSRAVTSKAQTSKATPQNASSMCMIMTPGASKMTPASVAAVRAAISKVPQLKQHKIILAPVSNSPGTHGTSVAASGSSAHKPKFKVMVQKVSINDQVSIVQPSVSRRSVTEVNEAPVNKTAQSTTSAAAAFLNICEPPPPAQTLPSPTSNSSSNTSRHGRTVACSHLKDYETVPISESSEETYKKRTKPKVTRLMLQKEIYGQARKIQRMKVKLLKQQKMPQDVTQLQLDLITKRKGTTDYSDEMKVFAMKMWKTSSSSRLVYRYLKGSVLPGMPDVGTVKRWVLDERKVGETNVQQDISQGSSHSAQSPQSARSGQEHTVH